MRTKPISLLSICLMLFFLTGCAAHNARKSEVIGNDVGVVKAEQKLVTASEDVNSSLQELAAIEKATHPQVKMPNPMDPTMIGMGQLLSIDWTGPIGPLVHKIAKISDYKVRTLGTAPAIPVVVSITAKNTPLADILRDANFQCGQHANIAVYPANKIIELRYVRK